MSLTTPELDSLRFHLGYGNLSTAAEPYTPDTYYEVFSGIVSPYLSTGTETSSSTSVTAGSTAAITVVSATNISVYGQLIVDVAEQAEVVTVKSVSGTSVTAYFAKAHSSTYPVATMSGLGRLRLLLHDADLAWRALTSAEVGGSAGISSVDKNDVVFFRGFAVLKGRLQHYQSVVSAISSLVQVPPQWAGNGGGGGRLEAY